jgi:MoxR-like ATPase
MVVMNQVTQVEYTEGALEHGDLLELGKNLAQAMIEQVGKSLIGYEKQTFQVIATMVMGGHALVLGDVGAGKTRFGQTIAKLSGLKYTQVSMNAEIRPSYFTGKKLIEADYSPGILDGAQFFQADEINRACQATLDCLLSPLESGVVNVSEDGHTYETAEEFFTLATLNPIDRGLDRALRDRFTILISPPELTEVVPLRVILS